MYTINLLVKDGPYSDGTFTLQQAEVKWSPRLRCIGEVLIIVGATALMDEQNRSEFWFGRSTGKRFKESGVSLPQDLEVSTKHGKVRRPGPLDSHMGSSG
jgi:hypothetical protein